jgi:hypothetical protein
MRIPPMIALRPETIARQTRVDTTGIAASASRGAGVQPQGCGVFDWIKCGAAIAGCAASCVALGPACIPGCVASAAPACVKCL